MPAAQRSNGTDRVAEQPVGYVDGDSSRTAVVTVNGKSFELPYVEINVARGGRLASHRVYYDQVSFMAALGIARPQG